MKRSKRLFCELDRLRRTCWKSAFVSSLLLVKGVVAQGGGPSVFVNALPDDVDIAAEVATQVQVGTTPGAEVFVTAIATGTEATLTADNVYLLGETLFVMPGAVLNIEAGTIIYNASFENGPGTADNVLGSIVVTRGGQINVLGTAEEPVVMTTTDSLEALRGVDIDNNGVVALAPDKETMSRWGGLVILGNAFVSNQIDSDSDRGNGNEINLFESSIEGFAGGGLDDLDLDGFSDLLEFGNSANIDPDVQAVNNVESSGRIEFLSLRHGGFALADGNEINGLTMGGVGSGTIVSHVEVVSNADDGFEWFGGTVGSDHLVSSFVNDDSFDFDLGHRGFHQFWFVIYDETGGDHAGEWDGVVVNFGDDAPGDGLENSMPLVANATFLDAGNSASTEAFRFDDFFAGVLIDSAIDDFGVDETYDNRADGFGTGMGLANNLFAGNNNEAPRFGFDGNEYDTDLGLVSVTSVPNGLLDPRPSSASPLVGTALDTSLFSELENVSYRGAFDPDAELFIQSWTFLAEEGFLVPPDGVGGVEVEEIVILNSEVSNGSLLVAFRADSSTFYNVMSSTDLEGFETFVMTVMTDGSGMGSVSLPLDEERLFIRIEGQ